MDIMIETKDLAKAFRSNGSLVKAVKAIDLIVGKGEIFSLLGQNGAGKTATI